MSMQAFLEQMLKTGLGAVDQAKAATAASARSGDLGKYASGAAVGGVLALLLGSRRGRGLGGSAIKLGGIAAIGTLAYKAWQDYQAAQGARAQTPAPAPAAAPSFTALPAPQQEQHSQALMKAMIAAAKSDGHIDERERQLVLSELDRQQAGADVRQWVDFELRRPLSAAEVAAVASGPEMAAEVYLASLLVTDDQSPAERAYLDQLATQLRLAPELKADLEAKAAAAL